MPEVAFRVASLSTPAIDTDSLTIAGNEAVSKTSTAAAQTTAIVVTTDSDSGGITSPAALQIRYGATGGGSTVNISPVPSIADIVEVTDDSGVLWSFEIETTNDPAEGYWFYLNALAGSVSKDGVAVTDFTGFDDSSFKTDAVLSTKSEVIDVPAVESFLTITAGAVSVNAEDVTVGSADKLPTSQSVKAGLATKEPALTAGTSAQYYRGDKTFQTLDSTAVGLGNVDNTADADKPVSTAAQTALDLKADSTVVTEIDGNVDDLVTLSGVAENSTDLGTFTGTTITDNVVVKTALQELETAVETKATTATLASTLNGNGASLVGIEDANARYTASTVEAALDEVKALADLNALGVGAQWAMVDTHTMSGDGNITLSGEQTIDGVLTSASRVLLTDQTDAAENGLYLTAAGAWSRTTDADASTEWTANKTVFVSGGTMGGGHTMKYTGASNPTLGTDSLTFITASLTVIGDGSVTTAKLAADAVNGSKIADDSIDSEHIVDGSVDAAHLAADSVETAKILDANVTKAKLATAVQDVLPVATVNASAGSTTFTLDSVLVDDIELVEWHVVAYNGTAKESQRVTAQHNGDGSTDATAADSTLYAHLGNSNVAGFSVTVDVNGTGGSQTMRLRCASTSDIGWKAVRVAR